MKTSKQDIHDLLSQLAADIEEIKAMLNGAAAGKTNATSNDVAIGNGAASCSSATDYATSSNASATDYATIGNGSAAANPNRIIAEINRMLEPIADVCSKLPDRIKSYYAQLLLRIPQDLREELTRDNDTRKRKGQSTVEDKIDNSLTLLVSIYDRLNQLENVLHTNTSKLRIVSWFKSVLSGVQRLRSKRQSRWYCKPYILCAIGICLLYFALSIFSWAQWHHYREENTRLRLTADKYRVDSVIIREIYPQAAITLSAYEHITETEGADVALHAFRNKVQELDSKHKSKSKQNHNE